MGHAEVFVAILLLQPGDEGVLAVAIR